MASSSKTELKVAVILIFFFIYLLSKPVGLASPTESVNEREKLVGSRPPACTNKCLSCKPCMVTLVIQPHRRQRFRTSRYDQEGDNSYYPLSWKCKCGNKLFQP